ncbi:MAG: class I SAM-dependent methyltransferase [Kofleriaceae bacterium]
MLRSQFALVLGLGACSPTTTPPPATPTAPAPHAQHDHDAHHGHHQAHAGGMQHRFENAEQWAKVFDDPARDAWQEPDKVVAALALSATMTVADVGAGTGYFAVRLARAVPNGSVIATDIEPDMVRYMADRAKREQIANLISKHTPPDDPQLAAASLDRILVVDVWHHLGDRVAYAKHLASALRPGGRLAIVDFKLDASMGPPKQHRLAPDAIATDLRAAGLTVAPPIDLKEQYILIATR